MTRSPDEQSRPGTTPDGSNAQQPSPTTDLQPTDGRLFCAFPAQRVVTTRYRRMCRPLAEFRASQLREPGAGVDLPTRLDSDQRLAQIRHAIAGGFLPWEIAALVPEPVSVEERAAATRSVR